MTENSSNISEIAQYIIDLIEATDPETVEELAQRVEDKFGISKDEAVRHIISLEDKDIVKLEEKPAQTAQTLTGYLSSGKSLWYWTTLTLVIATTISVFIIPESAYPLTYIRHVLGLIFVLWLPGYSLIKALFPTKEIDSIERISLSIAVSLALVPITGLLLNYTPWGIRLTPITLSLLALTLTLATTALLREHQIKTKTQ